MADGYEILRYTAFSDDPAGGNPAGVVLDATGLDDAAMLAIAADLGYSETAFLLPGDDPGDGSGPGGRTPIRYFSPLAEVPFCGHATIATGVAYADRHGPGPLPLRLASGGEVDLDTSGDPASGFAATLTSVETATRPAAADEVGPALAALGWRPTDVDPDLPAHVAFAGAYHLVLAAATRERLADLDYDFDALGALMAERDWTTVQLVWREDRQRFHARDPFPPGGVVEDPATGAAAAAFGGYLRDLGLVTPPAEVTIHQGDDLGRPSLLRVGVDAGTRRVRVTGRAVALR